MNLRVALLSFCALLGCALPPTASAQDTAASRALDVFSSGKWHFVSGAEFPPGGRGEVTQTTESGAPVGVLAYNFTEGGTYVGAERPVVIEEGFSELRFRLKADQPLRAGLRLIDASGQTHQFKFGYEKSGEWQLMRVNLAKKTPEFYGGAKDGLIQYPIKRLCVIVQGRGLDEPGQLKFTEFRLLK